MAATQWTYTQQSCDVWQIAHLCDRFAGYGWDVVAIVESYPGAKVYERVGDEASRLVPALKSFVVLFRRPLGTEDEENAR
jgi:hypothetical protein